MPLITASELLSDSNITFDSALLDDLGSMTVLAYIKPTSVDPSTFGYFFGKTPTSSTSGKRFFITHGGSPFFSYGDHSTSGVAGRPQVNAVAGSVVYNSWGHYAFTTNGGVTVADIKLYAGVGVPLAEPSYSTSSAGSTAIASDAANAAVLFNRLGGSRGINGHGAYVAIWNRELSQAELQNAQTNGPLAEPTGLVLLWANNQDYSDNAIVATSRSTYNGGGDLPPNLNLGGAAGMASTITATFSESATLTAVSSGLVSSISTTFSESATLAGSGSLASTDTVTFSESATLTGGSSGLNITLLTADTAHRAATYTRDTLIGWGHSVTMLLESTVTGAASFGTPDIIVVARAALTAATAKGHLRAAIDSGIPAIIGFVDSGINTTDAVNTIGTLCDMKLATSVKATASIISNYILDSGHPIVADLTGLPAQKNTHSSSTIHAHVIDNGHIGTALASLNSTTGADEITCFIIEAGTNDLTTPTPVPVGARVVVLGPLYSLTTITWTTDFMNMLQDSITWVTGSATLASSTSITFSESATLTVNVTELMSNITVGFSESATLTNGTAIVLDANYERAAVDAANSSVVGAGDDTEIFAQPRYQIFEGAGVRWLEVGFRLTGVLGWRPTINILDYTSTQDHDYPIATTKRWMHTYDRENFAYIDTMTAVASSHISLRHNTAFTADEVWITRSRQISVTQCGNRIAALESAYSAMIEPTITSAAFTPVNTTTFPAQAFIAAEYPPQTTDIGDIVPDVPLYMFQINDTSLMPTSGAKRNAFINMGTHAGEDLGDWAGWIFIEWLCSSSDANAQSIRRHFKIIVCALLNASARYGGGSRGNFASANPTDANRHFSDASPALNTVTIPRPVFIADLAGSAPAFMIDFHGTYINTWSQFENAGHVIQALFRSRLTANFGTTIADEGTVPTGSVSYWFEHTMGCPAAILLEFGDNTPTTETQYQDFAVALGTTIESMRFDGYIPSDGPIRAVEAVTFSTSATLSNASTGELVSGVTSTFTPAAVMQGTGALITADTATFTPNVVLGGIGALASVDTATLSESVTLTGNGIITSAEATTFTPTVALSGRGSLASGISPTFSESVTLSISSANDINSQTSVVFAAAGTLTGHGTLTAADTIAFSTAATMTSSSSTSSAIGVTFTPTAILTAAGALANIVAVNVADSVTLSIVTASGDLISDRTVSFSEAVVLSGLASVNSADALTFSTIAELTAYVAAGATSTIAFNVSATLEATGSLVVDELLGFSSNAILTNVPPADLTRQITLSRPVIFHDRHNAVITVPSYE